ncbi:sensor histidine kinase [Rodentibacter pneumotropicus]|nr:sensor histidine kinase [Rodentibacter pneumotropicus]
MLLKVEDNGKGIPKKRKHVLDPFYQILSSDGTARQKT